MTHPADLGLRAWTGLSLLLALGAIVGAALSPGTATLDWQPAHAFDAPWRWWSAAFVHFSVLHLVGNLLGVALLAALGSAAQLPWRAALAWFIAWPLTHLALLVRPDLAHYGGLSGVLHAGIMVAAWHLVHAARRRPRIIGGALMLGMAVKLLTETPWGPALRHPPDWDIAIAPIAHATGAIGGLLCAVLIDRRPSRHGPVDSGHPFTETRR